MDNRLRHSRIYDKRLFLVAICVYVLAATMLTGYYHPDEHYQILEFADYKLGRIATSGMPWEFTYGMRSSFQPWIAYWTIRLFNALHMDNPYRIALFLRLLTACLCLYAIRSFLSVTVSSVHYRLRPYYKWAAFFLWIIPYFSVRFSSEIWSGSLFLLSTCCLVPRQDSHRYRYAMIGGILCGFSFLCRFQSATMIAGLVLWLLFVKKENWKYILTLLASSFVVLVFGVCIDYLFYGYWLLTPWNYFDMNVVNDMASGFGTMDIFKYLQLEVRLMVVPIGIAMIVCILYLMVYEPKSFALWCILPLIIIHLLIPHKEPRFLVPVMFFLPYIVFRSATLILKAVQMSPRLKTILKPIFIVCAIVLAMSNGMALIISVFSAPVNGRIAITKFIYDHYGKDTVHLYAVSVPNPYKPYSILTQSFYAMKNVSYIRLHHYDSLAYPRLYSQKVKNLLVLRRAELKRADVSELIHKTTVKIIKTGNPLWIDKIRNSLKINDSEYILCEIRN